MAKRVVLYEETENSTTQFNPVTDIGSVFHGPDQTGDGSNPEGNSIFTNKQETLLTVLSRINSWLYKLRALNDYKVASNTVVGDKDLALQKTVNRQISELREEVANVRNDVSGNETDIGSLQQKTNYLDDIIIDMAYHMDCITDANVLVKEDGIDTSFYTYYIDSLGDAGSTYIAHDDKLLLLGIKVAVDDYKFYLFEISIAVGNLSSSGPSAELLTTKNSSDIKIHHKDSVDTVVLPSDACDYVIDFNDGELIIYFLYNGGVSIMFKAATASYSSIGGIYTRIIQGIPKQSSPKK